MKYYNGNRSKILVESRGFDKKIWEELVQNPKYKKYFTPLRDIQIEDWLKKEEIKKFIDDNGRLPQRSIEQEKTNSYWIDTQKKIQKYK